MDRPRKAWCGNDWIGYCAEDHARIVLAVFSMEAAVESGLVHGGRGHLLDPVANRLDGTHQLVESPTDLDASGSWLGSRCAKSVKPRINEDNIRNSGINPALMRYLVTLPPEDPLRKNDPGYVPIFNTPPRSCPSNGGDRRRGAFSLFGWHTRRPYQGAGDHEWPRECSILLIVMLLLSPLTWIQHLPWLLPALYWVVAKTLSQDGLGPWSKGALGIYIMVAMVLNYELLGKNNYTIFLSYKPFTIGMIMILAIVMTQSGKVGGFSHRVLAHAK